MCGLPFATPRLSRSPSHIPPILTPRSLVDSFNYHLDIFNLFLIYLEMIFLNERFIISKFAQESRFEANSRER